MMAPTSVSTSTNSFLTEEEASRSPKTLEATSRSSSLKENRKLFLSFLKQNSVREFFVENARITYSHKKDMNECGRKGGLIKLNLRNNIWVSNFSSIPQEMEELKKAQTLEMAEYSQDKLR